jgi:hypothetical protein
MLLSPCPMRETRLVVSDRSAPETAGSGTVTGTWGCGFSPQSGLMLLDRRARAERRVKIDRFGGGNGGSFRGVRAAIPVIPD